MEKQTIVLEPSTNSHTIEGKVKLINKLENLGGMVLNCTDKAVVLHGEHGVIVTEAENVIKLVQQECNPLTKQMQNSFD